MRPTLNSHQIAEALKVHQEKQCILFEQVRSGSSWTGPRLSIMDVVGFRRSWSPPEIRGYEIKVSRSDFTGDKKFVNYLELCHRFYWVCEKGLIDKGEIDKMSGLIYVNAETGKARTVQAAKYRKIQPSWEMLLYIIMWRLDPQNEIQSDDRKEVRRRRKMTDILKEMEKRADVGAGYRRYISKALNETRKELIRQVDRHDRIAAALETTLETASELGLNDGQLADLVESVARDVRYARGREPNWNTLIAHAQEGLTALQRVGASLGVVEAAKINTS